MSHNEVRYRVKNWEKFQHYKDRNPPWIRMHKSLLDNQEFHELTPFSSKLLMFLWLLASENVNGYIPLDEKRIAFRTRLPLDEVKVSLDELVGHGFLLTCERAENSTKSVVEQLREKNNFGSRYISNKVKGDVWNRDGGKCQQCGTEEDIEFDHIHPISKGGTSEMANIQLLCRSCNRRKRTQIAGQSEQVATQNETLLRKAQPLLERCTTETERETERERDRERETERERQRERETERERDRERERERDRERETERQRERQRERDRERDRER